MIALAPSASHHSLEEEVHVEPPRDAREDRDFVWKCLRALPGLKGGLRCALDKGTYWWKCELDSGAVRWLHVLQFG